MSCAIWNLVLFHRLRLNISFNFMQYRPNVCNAGKKVTILISEVFQRLLNSLDTIFRRETLTAPQWKPQKQISRQVILFTFYRQNYFFGCSQWPHAFHFRFKTAEWEANFVVCLPEVSLRIISFRCPFGLPVWNFGRLRVNLRRLWQLGTR